MNMEPKQTILYGGAFNPPTKAHAAIVTELSKLARNEGADLWMMPSGNRRDKTILAELAIRTAYIHALLASGETHGVDTRIETYELSQTEPTETYVTNEHLMAQHPDRLFTWVFGSDSVNTMRRWHNGEWMLEHMHMIVVERPGYELVAQPAHYKVLQLGKMAVSSSEVRRRIHEGDNIEDVVPAPVIGVIKQAGTLVIR